MKSKLVYICFLALLFVSAGCSRTTKTRASSQKHVLIFVTIAPQKSIVQTIGGRYVYVRAMVPPGKDPHDYKPIPTQILALCLSKAYFEIGMPFESIFLSKVKNFKLKIDFVDMCKGAEKLTSYVNGKKVVDPHLWLSPDNVKILAKNTLVELIKLMPAHKDYFTKNYDEYIARLDAIDRELKTQLAPFKGETFFVYHPAFGYFAKHFGLKQKSVEIEGKEPTPKELLRLIMKAKDLNVKIIFVEPQFSRKSARALAEAIQGSVISINPLAENVLKNFQGIADKIEKSFKLQKSH